MKQFEPSLTDQERVKVAILTQKPIFFYAGR